MAGTDSTPIFVKDNQYMSMVADNAISLGDCVQITTTGTDTCDVAAANTVFAGVAVSGDRYSRTSTDDSIAAGNRVTVCRRGIVRVYTGTSTIVRGSFLELGAAGVVELAGTAGTATDIKDVIGIALEANAAAAATIRMLML